MMNTDTKGKEKGKHLKFVRQKEMSENFAYNTYYSYSIRKITVLSVCSYIK